MPPAVGVAAPVACPTTAPVVGFRVTVDVVVVATGSPEANVVWVVDAAPVPR